MPDPLCEACQGIGYFDPKGDIRDPLYAFVLLLGGRHIGRVSGACVMARDQDQRPIDVRPVDVRAESAVFEFELENEGLTLSRCPCGTAELEMIPDSERGFRCVGCKRVVYE